MIKIENMHIITICLGPVEGEAAHREGAMESPEDGEGRTFVEVISEKYSPENFPYRRGPGMGVVVVPVAVPQGSPLKGELERSYYWLC